MPAKQAAGITPGLLRLSVGIEHVGRSGRRPDRGARPRRSPASEGSLLMIAQAIRIDETTRPTYAGQGRAARQRHRRSRRARSPRRVARHAFRQAPVNWSTPPIRDLSLHDPDGLDPDRLRLRACRKHRARARERAHPKSWLRSATSGVRIVIDATADAGGRANHPALLDAGIHVATACKLAGGTSLTLWREIQDACERSGSGFGDRATVGAGLPLLRSLRELQRGRRPDPCALPE